MPNFYYITPNKEYGISKANVIPEWEEAFGETWFICKYSSALQELSNEMENKLTGWVIMEEACDLESCFAWLRERNIISKDEEKAEVERIKREPSNP